MSYLHDSGYPVPRVEEISADGRDLFLQRIDGPTMVATSLRRPWVIRSHGRTLAELHKQLHAIPVPPFLPPAEIGTGNQIVHMDLHPLNVIMGTDGPVVIDWARAGRGSGAMDVTIAWMVMASAVMPATTTESALVRFGRWQLAAAFTSQFDADIMTPCVMEVAEWKAKDPNLSELEIATMRRLAAEAPVRFGRLSSARSSAKRTRARV